MARGGLAGEVVLVTGAARGIGRAIAETAVAQGAVVGLVDVLAAELWETRDRLGESAAVHAAVADITDEAAVAAAAAEIAGALGPVTVLVNNAGRNSYADPIAMTAQEWDAVFDVDLKGAWLAAKAVLPGMVERGGGAIVNIASIHATVTTAGMFPYAAAKAGLVGFTKSLALDVAHHGIRVNAVSPGFIRTALVDEYFGNHTDPDAEQKALTNHPLGRLGTPQDVAEVVCFLASPAAAFVTAANWSVDGGLGARFP
ncbi:SDR family NAD(P)-dependent oxidoreductase [Actinokineospora globicatena]|uniref:Short-chain dehydrogenase/reductase n=1 Tax=Actinokineospora globicatena TaxID=103729 RepID=A0A9W6QJC9_9PSEU|nr:glucose 1-dehydrogenase [Actinokineospora globicatena]GLW89755.1 short-chain dehydrogenase/reductase [Actinokineospora globicatena]